MKKLMLNKLSEIAQFSRAADHYYYDPESGELWSAWRRLRKLKSRKDRDGYLHYEIRTSNGRRMRVQVSHIRISADGRPRPGSEYHCDHIDRDIANNDPSNLRWVLPHENRPLGIGHRKLSDSQVALLKDASAGTLLGTKAKWAEMMNVTKRTISNAMHGLTHRNVDALKPEGRVRLWNTKTGEEILPRNRYQPRRKIDTAPK